MTARATTKAEAMAANKVALIEARRAGDDELAKRLSQERQAIKKRHGECPDCGVTIHPGANHCTRHSLLHRFYSRSLPEPLAALLAIAGLLGCLGFSAADGPRPSIAQRMAIIKAAMMATNSLPPPKGPGGRPPGAKDLTGAPSAPKVAQSVTVAWDPTPDPRPLAFYRLYHGTQSGALTDYFQTTNTTVTVGNLPNGGTTYFAATVAVDSGNGNWQESDKSVEVSYTVPWQSQGTNIITVQPQWSMDGGFSFKDIGVPVVLENPQAPTILFKLSITQTNL